MADLMASPYDGNLRGFRFSTLEEYESKLTQAERAARESGGGDFEHVVYFMGGEDDEKALYDWISGREGLHPPNVELFFETYETFGGDSEFEAICIHQRERGTIVNDFRGAETAIIEAEENLIDHSTLLGYVEEYVDSQEGQIPKNIFPYIDTKAMARDWSHDIYEIITSNGSTYLFHAYQPLLNS